MKTKQTANRMKKSNKQMIMMKMLTEAFNQMTKVTSTLVNMQDSILNM